MKKFLILFLIFLVGCKSLKVVDDVVNNQKSITKDSLVVYYDTIPYYVDEYVDKYELVESIEYKRNEEIHTSNAKKLEYNIINYVDTTKLLDKGFGTIAYNVPQKFVVNEYSTIKLRISKSKEIQSVIVGDRNIPIVGTNSDDDIILETIQVDSIMTATLYTDDGLFEVSMVNKNEKQSLSEFGYTEWVWRVRPLKSGNHYIKMLITISGRDIVVYEKSIPVESNWKFSFSNWFSKWWQAITATIITPILIPFFIWLYKKRKKDTD